MDDIWKEKKNFFDDKREKELMSFFPSFPPPPFFFLSYTPLATFPDLILLRKNLLKKKRLHFCIFCYYTLL